MKPFLVETWAAHYDAPVTVSDEDIPFVGSERALVETVALAETKPGARVRLVDEWIETGAQVQAAITLIEQAGALSSALPPFGWKIILSRGDCARRIIAMPYGRTIN